MYFVGIDIAKRFHEAAVVDEQGKVIVMIAVKKMNQPVKQRGIIAFLSYNQFYKGKTIKAIGRVVLILLF